MQAMVPNGEVFSLIAHHRMKEPKVHTIGVATPVADRSGIRQQAIGTRVRGA